MESKSRFCDSEPVFVREQRLVLFAQISKCEARAWAVWPGDLDIIRLRRDRVYRRNLLNWYAPAFTF